MNIWRNYLTAHLKINLILEFLEDRDYKKGRIQLLRFSRGKWGRQVDKHDQPSRDFLCLLSWYRNLVTVFSQKANTVVQCYQSQIRSYLESEKWIILIDSSFNASLQNRLCRNKTPKTPTSNVVKLSKVQTYSKHVILLCVQFY